MKLTTYKTFFYLLFSIFTSVSLSSFSQNKLELQCATETTDEFITHLKKIKPELKTFEHDFFQKKSAKTMLHDKIPVKFHIIRNTDGSGGLTVEDLDKALLNLNAIYNDSYMAFYIYEDVNFIDNDQLCHVKKDNEGTLIKSNYVPGLINIFFTNYIENTSEESICGYTNTNEEKNMILMKNSCATNDSSLAHELGHIFSLQHTHGTKGIGNTTELVDGSNCDTDGDGICDTPADPGLSNTNIDYFCDYIGDAKDANGQLFTPDTGNIMSYSRKACRNHFSEQQFARIYAYYKTIESKITDPKNFVESKEINLLSTDLKIYPNPVRDNLLKLSLPESDSFITYEITNYQGQILQKGTVLNGEIGLSHLSSGSYLLILNNSKSKLVRKFIK